MTKVMEVARVRGGGKGAQCDLGLIWGRAGVIWGHSVVCLPLGDLGTFWEVLRPWAVFWVDQDVFG